MIGAPVNKRALRFGNRLAIDLNKRIPAKILLGISALVMLLLVAASDLTFTECFVVSYFIFTTLLFVNNFGHTICLFDFLIFSSALDTLLSPVISYNVFNKSNHLALIWGRYMSVSEEVYFSYMIPANIAFFIGLHGFFSKNVESARYYVERAKQYVADKLRVGVAFIAIGVVAGFFINIVPTALSYIFYLLSMLTYAGGFYIYFSLKKRRNLIITLMMVMFFVQAARTGMFGEFFLFIILAICLIISQYKFSFLFKLLFFTLGISFVLIIQNVKLEYRYLTWAGAKNRSIEYVNKSNLEIFSDLFIDRVTNADILFSERSLFFINTRFNQGWLIALTMNYVPRVEPFAYGQTIWLSLAAVAVPRFLWPDKPESGGHLNLARFVGIKKKLSYSMNIGPYGEGYGNFGPVGGVAFVFLYGVLLAYFLHRTLEISKKYPSVVIWIPLLFYYVLTVETDTLTTLNSFVKAAIFIYILYLIGRRAYRINI